MSNHGAYLVVMACAGFAASIFTFFHALTALEEEHHERVRRLHGDQERAIIARAAEAALARDPNNNHHGNPPNEAEQPEF